STLYRAHYSIPTRRSSDLTTCKCSCTVNDGNNPFSCGTQPNPCCTRLGTETRCKSLPCNRICPRSGTNNPIKVLIRVVLPAPLRPRTAKLCPGAISKSNPLSTCAPS